MEKTHDHAVTAQPRLHQTAPEIQAYGSVSHSLPLELEEPVRLEITERLNQLLADTITIRDLYKKSHWQVAGPTFYQLHLLFDKHFEQQSELVDAIAERIRALGFPAPGTYTEFAKLSSIPETPGVPPATDMVRLLVEGHEAVARTARKIFPAVEKASDEPTADLLTQRLQVHEKTAWMLRSLLEA